MYIQTLSLYSFFDIHNEIFLWNIFFSLFSFWSEDDKLHERCYYQRVEVYTMHSLQCNCRMHFKNSTEMILIIKKICIIFIWLALLAVGGGITRSYAPGWSRVSFVICFHIVRAAKRCVSVLLTDRHARTQPNTFREWGCIKRIFRE